MSKAISKWVVCPVNPSANMTELDANIGTEDEAFRENMKEAYAKFTGYEKPVPGEKCEKKEQLDAKKFPMCKGCDFNELHSNHPEKYTKPDGSLEKFICPLKPPEAAT